MFMINVLDVAPHYVYTYTAYNTLATHSLSVSKVSVLFSSMTLVLPTGNFNWIRHKLQQMRCRETSLYTRNVLVPI